MVAEYNEHMERAEPFHIQNTPHSLTLSSLPFCRRLYIDPKACIKTKRASLVANQRIWINSKWGQRNLVVFTDGSKTDRAAGWAIRGIHAGRLVFSHKVPLAVRASNHDAEMMALAHASRLVRDTMLRTLDIREFHIFSDSTAALTSIFDPAPHAAQQASLLFRTNMLQLFSQRKDVEGQLQWTPGHSGLDHMTITDKNAKAAANRVIASGQYLLPVTTR